MTPRRGVLVGGLAIAALAIGWVLFVGVPRWSGKTAGGAAAPASAQAAPGRKIKARLFYVNEDGTKLTGVERDVAYGEGTIEQAKAIVAAQISPVAEPLVSAVPPGTALRALYVTPDGSAYVDLSASIARAHPGGTLNEFLTIYTLVDALTANLPAVSSVHLLVEGKEVDTLAGHVDLRRPLIKNLEVVE